MERFGYQILTLVVTVVLARVLGPEVSGTITLVTVFITILNVFVESGLGTALIQKKDADDVDFSTVFYFNIGFSVVLYAVMFFLAEPIAAWYEKPELVAIIRVLCITVLASGVKNVQQAYVSRNMQFRKFFRVTLSATFGSAVVGIAMAYMGFGVWALVGQNLSNAFISVVVLWFTVEWRPRLVFSINRLKRLFSFGWKLLVSALMDTLYSELSKLIIGKRYTDSDLAFYDKGNQFPRTMATVVNSSIDSVLLPVMSSAQDDADTVRRMTRRAIKTSTYCLMPMMMGLAVCAEPIVYILLGEEWLFCVPYLQIACFAYAFYPIHTANLNAIKAMGRSDIYLVLEIIKKVFGVTLLLISVPFGVMAIAASSIISTIVSQIINSWPNRKLLRYNYLEQLADMLPSIALTLVMGAAVYSVSLLGLGHWLTLIIQVPLGAAIYVLLSAIFKLESFRYVWSMAKSFLKKNKKTEQ